MSSRILVVDDERSIRLFLEAILVKEDYRVEVAASGEEALARLREGSFDLLLVDLKMGDVDGLQVMAECRRLSPETAVVVLTGHGSMDSAIQALRMGASDYLLKPCSDRELKGSVQRALTQSREEARAKDLVNLVTSWAQGGVAQPQMPGGASEAEAAGQQSTRSLGVVDMGEDIIRVGDLLFDRRRRLAALRGRSLALTPTEFGILICLAEKVDCPVSCREIVLFTHGYQCHESEAGQLVKLHVKNLRQKIEPDPANPRYLRNVRGVGYMLCGSASS